MVRIAGHDHLTEVRRRFGLGASLAGLMYRVSRRTLQLRIEHLIAIEVQAVKIQDRQGIEYRFLNADEVLHFSGVRENDMNESMHQRLHGGLDFCFAAIADGELANCSWYALDSIEGEHCSGRAASFPSNLAYFFKSYTHPKYRGRGLNQIAIRLALHELADRGIQQVFGMVEMANWSSLRSCRHIGFRQIGWLTSIGWEPFRLGWASPSAASLGITFDRKPQITRR